MMELDILFYLFGCKISIPHWRNIGVSCYSSSGDICHKIKKMLNEEKSKKYFAKIRKELIETGSKQQCSNSSSICWGKKETGNMMIIWNYDYDSQMNCFMT